MCHHMEMIRIRKPINVTLDPSLVEELDAWLAEQPYKIARAPFVEAAIRAELARQKSRQRREGKR
jgi:metal-responsive CopG/Arc/MetJ family transcriptional regulator